MKTENRKPNLIELSSSAQGVLTLLEEYGQGFSIDRAKDIYGRVVALNDQDKKSLCTALYGWFRSDSLPFHFNFLLTVAKGCGASDAKIAGLRIVANLRALGKR